MVYQAYRSEIGRFAARHGYFGGAFSLGRMSWIKPNFLWMMFRSGWGSKAGQEVVLAVWLRRQAFDRILSLAVHSTFVPGLHGTEAEWKRAVTASHVRLQWDPDHDPSGAKQERRALQLGLRGPVLESYTKEWIVSIEDISGFVREQGLHAAARDPLKLLLPREDVYPAPSPEIARKLQLDSV